MLPRIAVTKKTRSSNGSQRKSTSSGKRNAIGYQKRKTKSKNIETSTDVYEYNASKSKRSRSGVTMLLDKHEIEGFGGGEGEGTETLGNMKLRFGPDDDGEVQIGSEDDEEIDSDDAFEGSDDERFATFKFTKQKTRKKETQDSQAVRFEVDLNEAEGVSEESDDEADDNHEAPANVDGFMDLSAMLDPVSEDSDGSESTSAEEEDQGASGEEEEDAGGLDKLGTFIDTLESSGKKRKASELDGYTPGPTRTKRRALAERTESGPEGEFASNGPSGGTKLRLEDLLNPLNSNGSSVALLALNNSVKVLKGTKGAPLPAPLPQRTQDRLDREAAYEQTKEEVQKWAPTMKRIREAEHLSFPLQAPVVAKASTAQLASTFKPSTELETAIDKLLKDANLREQDMARTEDLKMQDLTPEEVAQRRGELRKMRDLLYRAEIKAKRLAKIKSKTYRKILRKEKEKKSKTASDSLDHDEDLEHLKMQADRAKERATLRHKNTGKWAKSMRARGELEEDQRQEVQEMWERGEKLRRRIQGLRDDEDQDDDGDDSGEDVDAIKSKAFDELEHLMNKDTAEASAQTQQKGVLGMKFMQNAMNRERREVGEMEDDFRTQLARLGEADIEETTDGSMLPPAVTVERSGGRVTIRPRAAESTGTNGRLPSETSSVTLKSSPTIHTHVSLEDDSPPAPSDEANPWLTAPSSSTRLTRKNDILVGKNSSGASKSKNAIKKQLRKSQSSKDKDHEDAVVEIDINDALRPTKDRPSKTITSEMDFDDDDDDAELEEQEFKLEKRRRSKGAKIGAFEQRDLVSLAFAGDNVVQEFEEAKRKEIEGDAPRDIDTTIPGWGSWAGAGTKKRPVKPERITKIAGIAPTHRADFNKSHVIISEKRDKKAAKYMVKDLPYPYTSKAQYERSLEVPLGSEWNTRMAFQKATLPRVVKKMGTIIDPIEKLF